MQDKLFEEFINPDRWEKELEIATYKGISTTLIRQMTKPDFRIRLCTLIAKGEYVILPPRMQLIPKDNGKYRTVYINEDRDRVILSLINNILFDLCPDWISHHCTSYQKGIGTGKVVKRVSQWITNSNTDIIGYKTDLSKYFDSVPINVIDSIFDKLEERFGKSCIIDLLKKYYHQDACFDLEGNLIDHYQSLKQGCATASFFADVILYDIDEQMAKRTGNQYVRYSDDMLFICPNHEDCLKYLKFRLQHKGLVLNPEKVEPVYKNRWVKFLGFSVKGEKISLSKSRLKKFQKEIEKRTNYKASPKQAVNSVMRYLYKGYGKEGYCWATAVLSIINSEEDINELNKYVLDALKRTYTKHYKIGGLGYEHHENGVITRGKGKNVRANRKKVSTIDGYKSISCMRNALLQGKSVFNALLT